MPNSFDYSWSSGPMGPTPFLVFSQTTPQSERNFTLLPSGVLGGAGVFQLSGCIVQYSDASPAPAMTLFRRTLMMRTGSRGITCMN